MASKRREFLKSRNVARKGLPKIESFSPIRDASISVAEETASRIDPSVSGKIILIGQIPTFFPTKISHDRIVYLSADSEALKEFRQKHRHFSAIQHDPLKLPEVAQGLLGGPAAAIIWQPVKALDDRAGRKFLKAVLPILRIGAPLIYAGNSATPIPSNVLRLQDLRLVKGGTSYFGPTALGGASYFVPDQYVGIYRATKAVLKKFEVSEVNALLWRKPEIDEGPIGTDDTRFKGLPKKPPQLWPKRTPGRPSKIDSGKLLKFLEDVYGPYMASHRNVLRSYIFKNDNALYIAIRDFERTEALPAHVSIPDRTDRRLNRLREAAAAGFVGFTDAQAREARAILAASVASKPKGP